jgi:hypothetical protein
MLRSALGKADLKAKLFKLGRRARPQLGFGKTGDDLRIFPMHAGIRHWLIELNEAEKVKMREGFWIEIIRIRGNRDAGAASRFHEHAGKSHHITRLWG